MIKINLIKSKYTGVHKVPLCIETTRYFTYGMNKQGMYWVEVIAHIICRPIISMMYFAMCSHKQQWLLRKIYGHLQYNADYVIRNDCWWLRYLSLWVKRVFK